MQNPNKRKRYAYDVAQAYQAKKRRKTGGAYTGTRRAGYSTVARTRGVYAKGETKYFDSLKTITAIAASTNWTGTEYDPDVVPVANCNTLFAPTQGAGINQRIGKSVKVYKIRIHGEIQCPAQTNQTVKDAASVVRIALVQDMQTNSTQAQGEQVFTPPTTATATLAVESFQNIDNFGRFKVLKDKHFILENPSAAFDGTNIEQAGLIKRFKWTVKFRKPVEVRFNSTNGGTVADIVDNSWHIMANNNSTDLAPYIVYQCRVCFRE